MRWYKKASAPSIDELVSFLKRMDPDIVQEVARRLQGPPVPPAAIQDPTYDISGGPKTEHWYTARDPKLRRRVPKKYAPPWETPEERTKREREEMYMRAGWGAPPEDTLEDIRRRQKLEKERQDRPVDPSKPALASVQAFGPPLTDTNNPIMKYSPDIVDEALEDGGNQFPIPSPWPRPGKNPKKKRTKRRPPKRRPGPDLEEGYKRPTDGTGWPRPTGDGRG